MARTMLPVLALLAAGCSTAAGGDASSDRWYEPAEALEPRMATLWSEDDAGRPARVLQSWLDALGPDAVRRREGGLARLRITGRPDDEANDVIVRWRAGEEGLQVQVTSGGLDGDDCRGALASLAHAAELERVEVEPAPSSGCVPPEKLPPGACTWREAIDAEFARDGLVKLDEDPEQGGNVSWYGPAGGPAQWRVDIDGLDGPRARLEIFHEAVPFDAAGERKRLAGILRRLGVVPGKLGSAP
ncbi:MAG TPA: hypothetical protein VFS92_05160 [Planctomycetota bacterium]|nr:hypothetical protein [Planctomycetota bacterium]